MWGGAGGSLEAGRVGLGSACSCRWRLWLQLLGGRAFSLALPLPTVLREQVVVLPSALWASGPAGHCPVWCWMFRL